MTRPRMVDVVRDRCIDPVSEPINGPACRQGFMAQASKSRFHVRENEIRSHMLEHEKQDSDDARQNRPALPAD
jgi:hypothetical protein